MFFDKFNPLSLTHLEGDMVQKLNIQHIQDMISYEKLTQEEFITPLLETFKKSLVPNLQQMHDDLIKNDLLHLSQISHALKSSALQLGMLRLGHLFLTLETEGIRKSQFPFKKMLMELESEIPLSIKALEKYLKESKRWEVIHCCTS